MKRLNEFIGRFGTSISLDGNLVVEKQGRYFLLNQKLKGLVSKDFFYAGVYLGKVKDGVFFPSFNLLAIIAEKKEANRIMVDEKTEWLFICGRDIFKQGIIRVTGSTRGGDYTLVLNCHGECLGFGKILCNMEKEVDRHRVVVRNVSDIGDFLRRENNARYLLCKKRRVRS